MKLKVKVTGLSTVTASIRRYERAVDRAIKASVREFMERIKEDAMNSLSRVGEVSDSIALSYTLSIINGGYEGIFYTDNVLAAYIEFGTGPFAAAYLAGQPQEMQEEAIQFKMKSPGKTSEHPYLFPAYYRHREAFMRELRDIIDTYRLT